jgi:hypothetical protein
MLFALSGKKNKGKDNQEDVEDRKRKSRLNKQVGFLERAIGDPHANIAPKVLCQEGKRFFQFPLIYNSGSVKLRNSKRSVYRGE